MKKFELTGEQLTITEIRDFVADSTLKVEIPQTVFKKLDEVRKFLEGEMGKRMIYGVNTGFGPMASHSISIKNLTQLQENLILSHATGMGTPIPDDYVLAAMLVRLNTLAKGYSGVSSELVHHLAEIINARIIPIVPEHGAVGTSGDLVQLAHIALALLGKGKVKYEGKVMHAADALKKIGLRPYVLKPKEGLSLINGTSVMSGISALLCVEARQLVALALRNGALALELVNAHGDGFSAKLQEVRPHPHQILAAKILRDLTADSKLITDRDGLLHTEKEGKDAHEISESVQEVYSLRCIPQILAPILETLEKFEKCISIEINSATDNPIVDMEGKQFLHGGNFHGDHVAVTVDQLKACLVKLTMLAERRTNFFLNTKTNGFLPPFLNGKTPGLTLGLQGLQFVATSTTAQSQSLAFPHNVHSIPTNGDNQDIVSMGTDATLLAAKVIENAYIVLAIELIALAQAVDIRSVQKLLSTESRALYKAFRDAFPTIIEDRDLTTDLPRVLELLRTTPLGDTVLLWKP